MESINLLSIIGIAVGIVASVLGGAWFLLQKVFKAGATIQGINQKIKNLEEGHSSHTSDITIIKKWIMKQDNAMIDELAQKHSPLTITKLGEKVIEITGAGKIIPEMEHFLISEMEKRTIKTPFDAETEAYFALLRNENHDAFIPLKQFIYNEPEKLKVEVNGETFEVKLDFDSIVRVTSLKLRDIYLAKHPEIN